MEEFKMTKEEYEDLLEYITALRMKIQDLEDIVINDIAGKNISDDTIEARHIINSEIDITKLSVDLDDIGNGETYGKMRLNSLENGLALLSEAAGNLDDIGDGTYGKVLLTNITAGKIVLAECTGNIDNIANGISYGRVLLTNISAGHILLSACSGSMDDIDAGATYGKILSTSLQDSAILLSQVIGDLDNIDDGTSYGKVLSTDISSGHILLSACEGGLDDISNGVIYGKVNITAISSGNITLASCVGNLDNIANGTSYAKVALTSISAGKIIVAGLDSGITARMFADGATKTNIEAWKHASDVTMIDGGDIYTDSITVRKIVLDSAGYIYTTGKTSYTDTTAGFWLGYSSGYKLNIGSSSNYLKWTGSQLLVSAAAIRGRLTVGGGTGEDIYFEDSGIRMYDIGTLGIRLYKAGNATYDMILASDHITLKSNYSLYFLAGSRGFRFYNSGTLKLPTLTSAPTAHNGDLCIESSSAADADQRIHYYTTYEGAWQYLDDSAGW